MARLNLWFLGFIIVLLILWWIVIPNNETFEGIKPHYHVKLDKDCNVIYTSWQSPAQNGELGCALVPCPNKFGDNVTCWRCCNYR